MWYIINTVTEQLTDRNWLQRILKNRNSIESNKNGGTYLRFRNKNRDLWNDLTIKKHNNNSSSLTLSSSYWWLQINSLKLAYLLKERNIMLFQETLPCIWT